VESVRIDFVFYVFFIKYSLCYVRIRDVNRNEMSGPVDVEPYVFRNYINYYTLTEYEHNCQRAA